MSLKLLDSPHMVDEYFDEKELEHEFSGHVLTFKPLPREKLDYIYLNSLLKRGKPIQGFRQTMVGTFETSESQALVEKALIQMSLENDSQTLRVMQLFDREAEIDFVFELEKKYGMKLENLEAAAYLFAFTYDIWSLETADYSTEEDRERAESKLPGIIRNARRLANYQLEATHQVQKSHLVPLIYNEQFLKASTPEHYEGSGVYAGILGGYRSWGAEDTAFHFLIELADTLPMITDRKDPEAMVLVLAEEVDIHRAMEFPAEPMGAIYWENDDYFREKIDDWRLALFKKYVGVDAAVVEKQENEIQVLRIRTNEKPIIWASAAKALKMHKVILE